MDPQLKYVRSLHYDHTDGSIIYRKPGLISRIQSDGSVIYRYEVSGEAGLAVDTQGHVYVREQNKSEIQRLLPDGRLRDVILKEKDGIKSPFAIAFNESTLSVNIRKTLDHLRKDRNHNAIELDKSESEICEENKNLHQLKKEKAEISELYDCVQEKEQELEYLKEHGSNNQLYLKLREQGKGVQDVVKRVQEMTMSYKRAHLKFKKKADIDLKSMGSIFEVKEECYVQYSPVKLQQAQVQPVRVESINTFKKEITNQLNLSNNLRISDIAVTADNTLFFYQAVVTLPRQSYVQFINTKSLAIDKTVKVGEGCFAITTAGDCIAVGTTAEIRIFKQNGENMNKIALKDPFQFKYVRSLYYDHNNGSIIYRKPELIYRIQLNGSVSYQYELSGEAGLAVDTQGHVYVSEQNKSEIQRLLPDGRLRDVILKEKDGIKSPFAIAFNEKEKLNIDLSKCKKIKTDQLRGENAEISELYSNVWEREQELEFLKEHGSNNHLYLKLREQGKEVQDVFRRVQEMTMSYKRANLKFDKRAAFDLRSKESTLEIKEACNVQYSQVKFQQAQVQPSRVESVLTLKRETSTHLNLNENLQILD
ncbi:unnamed protein product [Mytilus coruscus]|uniref:Uncharacterized protein n=1 Tax=Mytilus coruscus TaxID=42192 RepID=A0A6J8EUZ6_MYTCO|nr:unnamed protein product [Mytilus coruscus]